MTTVTYYPKQYRMTIVGHAGYDFPGEDIVCAGISTLMSTLVAASTNEPEFQTSLYINHETAEIDIQSDPHEGFEDKCQTVYDTIYQGYLTVEESYPEYLKVTGGYHG